MNNPNPEQVPELSLDTVLSNLCIKDERNPLFKNIYTDPDNKPIARDDCYCDNCFEGRDKLAVEILRLKNILGQN